MPQEVSPEAPLPPPVDPRDRAILELVAAGSLERATEAAIRTWGSEIIGWLGSLSPSEADAHDAFSRMSEELWRSLPRFDGRCSLRTWCYMLARQAAARQRAQPRHRHEVLVSELPSLAGVVKETWHTTRRGEQLAANVYAEIRQELDEEDRTLVVLRVDRGLSWRDIAQVLLDEDDSEESVTRKAATLRKQFERVKRELRELAAARLREP